MLSKEIEKFKQKNRQLFHENSIERSVFWVPWMQDHYAQIFDAFYGLPKKKGLTKKKLTTVL